MDEDDAGLLIPLVDVKTFLRISGTADDALLQSMVLAAQDAWRSKGGPLTTSSQPIVEWHDGGSTTITPYRTPIAEIMTVSETIGTIAYQLHGQDPGDSADPWAYSVDADTSTITRRAAGIATAFADGERNIRLVYTSGYPTLPDDIALALKMLVKHLWLTQRGSTGRPNAGGDDMPQAGAAFMWPYRVLEILNAHIVPGIG